MVCKQFPGNNFYPDNLCLCLLLFYLLIAFSCFQIVEIVLRQGLVHPITCVPYLIALETDPEEVNSKLAHTLLINMNEKYVSLSEIEKLFLCMPFLLAK